MVPQNGQERPYGGKEGRKEEKIVSLCVAGHVERLLSRSPSFPPSLLHGAYLFQLLVQQRPARGVL